EGKTEASQYKVDLTTPNGNAGGENPTLQELPASQSTDIPKQRSALPTPRPRLATRRRVYVAVGLVLLAILGSFLLTVLLKEGQLSSGEDGYPKILRDRKFGMAVPLLRESLVPYWHRRVWGEGSFLPVDRKLEVSSPLLEKVTSEWDTLIALDDDPLRRWFEF